MSFIKFIVGDVKTWFRACPAESFEIFGLIVETGKTTLVFGSPAMETFLPNPKLKLREQWGEVIGVRSPLDGR